MAKGKNAAALFEVINRGRQENRKQAVTTTPSWWFKGRPTNGHAASPVADGEAQPYLKVDRDRHLISLRATFATGIIAVFAIVVIVGVAFIWGKHLGKSTADSADAGAGDDSSAYVAGVQTTDTNAPPAVIPGQSPGSDRGGSAQTPVIQPGAPIALTPGGTAGQQSEPRAQPAPPHAAPAPVPTAVTGERETGLNYVVMQSYPPDMVEAANEARDALMKHGIPCTVEPAPARLRAPRGWVSVIGTTGFSRISTADFKNYVRAVENVSAKMAGPKFKKLQPQGYKW